MAATAASASWYESTSTTAAAGLVGPDRRDGLPAGDQLDQRLGGIASYGKEMGL